MTTREKIKQKIDKIPDSLLDNVLEFINSMKLNKSNKREIHTFKLNGSFDNENIRSKAYE